MLSPFRLLPLLRSVIYLRMARLTQNGEIDQEWLRMVKIDPE